MLDTVWRASKINFDVVGFCKLYGIENVNKIFIQGGEGRRGKINEKSGFNALVSDNINPKEHVAEIQNFICKNADALKYLKLNDVVSVFDIGCALDNSHQFTKSIRFSSSLLGILHQYGIDVEFSLYPTEDEGGDV